MSTRTHPHYKVVEVSPVTDANIEEVLNEWTAQGWVLEDLRFVMRDGIRRPALAFVIFVAGAAPIDSS